MTNVTSQALVQGTLAATGLLLHILLPRALSLEQYGAYQTVLGMATIAAVFGGLRVHLLATQKVAHDPAAGGDVVAAAIRLVTTLALPMSVLLLTYAWVTDGRADVMKLAVAACVVVSIHQSFAVLQGGIQGLRRMQYQLPAILTWRLGELGTVALALALGADAVGVHWLRALWVLVGTLILWRALAGILALPSPWSVPNQTVLRLGRECIPYGVDGLFATAYLAVDVLVLAYFWGDEQVAVYGVAAIPLMNLAVLGFVINRVLFPAMASERGHAEKVGSLVALAVRLHVLLAFPIAIGGMIVAEPLLVFVFGAPFSASATPMMIMLPILPLRYINNGLGLTLTALGQQSLRARAIAWVAGVNLVANLWAIPIWGAVGAAATTLGSEFLLLVLYAAAVRPHIRGVHVLGSLVRTSASTVPMVAAVVATGSSHVALRIAAGAIVYAGAAAITGALNPRDIRRLRRA